MAEGVAAVAGAETPVVVAGDAEGGEPEVDVSAVEDERGRFWPAKASKTD